MYIDNITLENVRTFSAERTIAIEHPEGISAISRWSSPSGVPTLFPPPVQVRSTAGE